MAEEEHAGNGQQSSHTPDFTARGMAHEATQALRSHNELTLLRFKHMDEQHQELKDLIAATNKKIDDGFKSYDNKFWSLAVSIIGLLVSGIAMLLLKVIFPH